MRALFLAPILLLTLAANKDRDAAAVDKTLASKTAGAPQSCLSGRDAVGMNVYDGTILFRVSSKLVYRNDLNGCRMLHNDDIIQTNLYGSDRLCRGDIFQILDRVSGFPHGSCTFGDFVPYRTPGR
jgi:hypothetical protein